MRKIGKIILSDFIMWLVLSAIVIGMAYLLPSFRTAKTITFRYLCVVLLTVAVSVILYQLFGICGTERVRTTVLKLLIHFFISAGLTLLIFALLLPGSITNLVQAYNCLLNFIIFYSAAAIVVVYKMIQDKAGSLK